MHFEGDRRDCHGSVLLEDLLPGPSCDQPQTASAVVASQGLPVAVQSGPIAWQLEARFLDELGSVERLTSTVTTPGSAVIKTGPHRTVFRIDLPSGEYYVKQFRIAGWRAFLQNLIRPCKAELEWRAARRVAALGLPAIQPVAVGRTWRCGLVWDNFLVTRSLPGTVSLEQFLTDELQGRLGARRAEIRQRLADKLGELAGRMHARGVIHPDLHAGNLLVRLGVDDDIELWLIDLHAVRLRTSVSLNEAARNLAALNQFLEPRTTRADRRRFFRAYVSAGNSHTSEASLREFESLCRETTTRLWDRTDRAWSRGNRHQRTLQRGDTTGRCLAGLEANWLDAVCEAPETLFEQGLQWWCKQSGRRRVAAVSVPGPPGGEARLAYFKALEHTGLGRRLLSSLRRSSVRRAWETGHAFLRRGIATPRPLLFLEVPGEEIDRSYLLTEAVPDSVTLAEFCRSIWPGLGAPQQRRWIARLIPRLSRQLRWMHECRFDHRDLKFENILVRADAARTETWLLDLDAVRRWPVWPRTRAVQNLARLNVSTLHLPALKTTDRLRFLRHYLGGERSEWKTWWRQIAGKSQRKEQQNRRRGRPLS